MTRSGRPCIGVTTYQREHDGQRERFRLPTAYVDAVRAVGCVPFLLPPGEEDPGDVLDALDGLLLCGGGDLHPSIFGGEHHEAQFSVCLERDRFDLTLARAALERRMPLLAICRGMQVLNVALGGNLHVHLPDVLGEEILHRRSEDEPVRHPVRLDPNSRLAALCGSPDIVVTSWHHQAIDRLGEGLRPVAWAEDGTVEAVEVEGHPEVVAVQWHPEVDVSREAAQRRLFEALAEGARATDRPQARGPAGR